MCTCAMLLPFSEWRQCQMGPSESMSSSSVLSHAVAKWHYLDTKDSKGTGTLKKHIVLPFGIGFRWANAYLMLKPSEIQPLKPCTMEKESMIKSCPMQAQESCL